MNWDSKNSWINKAFSPIYAIEHNSLYPVKGVQAFFINTIPLIFPPQIAWNEVLGIKKKYE